MRVGGYLFSLGSSRSTSPEAAILDALAAEPGATSSAATPILQTPVGQPMRKAALGFFVNHTLKNGREVCEPLGGRKRPQETCQGGQQSLWDVASRLLLWLRTPPPHGQPSQPVPAAVLSDVAQLQTDDVVACLAVALLCQACGCEPVAAAEPAKRRRLEVVSGQGTGFLFAISAMLARQDRCPELQPALAPAALAVLAAASEWTRADAGSGGEAGLQLLGVSIEPPPFESRGAAAEVMQAVLQACTVDSLPALQAAQAAVDALTNCPHATSTRWAAALPMCLASEPMSFAPVLIKALVAHARGCPEAATLALAMLAAGAAVFSERSPFPWHLCLQAALTGVPGALARARQTDEAASLHALSALSAGVVGARRLAEAGDARAAQASGQILVSCVQVCALVGRRLQQSSDGDTSARKSAVQGLVHELAAWPAKQPRSVALLRAKVKALLQT